MLMIIDKTMISVFEEVENTRVYNFNTLYEGLHDASSLFIISDKLEDLTIYGTREFDLLYSSMIYDNEISFKSLFNIIYDLYSNIHVCIAVDFDNHGDYMAEALTKLIQQRYEYDATYIYEEEDIPALKDIEQEFGILGLFNLDEDKKRYLNILNPEEQYELDKAIFLRDIRGE